MSIAMQSYDAACGFSELNEDELFSINGGSGFSVEVSASRKDGGTITVTIGIPIK